ncbi:hypothetical protein CAPN010_22030 [Capnocytophaga cynodegmi]|uniref:DUF6261 family protein n=1 Tax=Capnocytophaga cynodegmi TaxID=28189 RepID=UPI001EE34573|nr:DUF6261 family protein [Capnocytophaga cynodegmi]GJQ08045.1 hypothetical protein CAPN010_22030 [Capnocytophaga cynodegmi]
MEIQEITLRTIPNGAHFAFHSEVLNFVESDTSVSEKIQKRLEPYKIAIAKEKEAMNQSQKSFKTDEIKIADKERDKLYMGFKSAVAAFGSIPDESIKEAQKRLSQLIKDYGIKTSMQLDEQTGLLVKFIDELETKYANDVTILGLNKIVTPLKQTNDRVVKGMLERDEEKKGEKKGSMKAARKEVDDAYRQLVKLINALTIVEGENDYVNCINNINSLITRYKRRVI